MVKATAALYCWRLARSWLLSVSSDRYELSD